MSLLEVKDLKVRVEEREILHGLSLTVNKGEVHAIMGPNGSGKSTLARALSGHPAYEVTGGSITDTGTVHVGQAGVEEQRVLALHRVVDGRAAGQPGRDASHAGNGQQPAAQAGDPEPAADQA